MNLKGLISDKTRLGLLSFIDDPEKEMKQMAVENEGMVDLNTDEKYDENGNPIVGDNNGQENQLGVQGGQSKGQESGGV
jgi:hypothetical protein